MKKKFKDPKGKEIFYENGEWFERLYPELTKGEQRLVMQGMFEPNHEYTEKEENTLNSIMENQRKKAKKSDKDKAKAILDKYLPKDARVLHFNIHLRKDKDYGKLVWCTGEGENIDQKHKSIQEFHN